MKPTLQPLAHIFVLPLLMAVAGCRVPAAPVTPLPAATPLPTLRAPATVAPTHSAPLLPAKAPPLPTPQQALTPGPAPTGVAGAIEAVSAALAERPTDLGAALARLQAWGALGREAPYREADLDGDGQAEVLLLVTGPREQMGLVGPGALVVLQRTRSGYALADSRIFELGRPSIAALHDLNADGLAEMALAYEACGAHTCFTNVQVFAYRGGRLRELMAKPASMPYAELKIEDADGDGKWEIVLHGGAIGSVGAGPVQARTETYAYDGQGWALATTVYDPSTVRVHVLYDGDRALRKGELEGAVALYRRVAEDGALGDAGFMPPEEERRTLAAWAYYRLVTALAALGDGPAARAALEALRARAPGHPCLPLAEAFWQAWQAQGNLGAGCAAVSAYAGAHPEVLESFGQYGYGNPGYAVEDLCLWK